MVYKKLVQSGQVKPKPDLLPPSVPMDYDWARVWEKNSFLLFLFKGQGSINIEIDLLDKRLIILY